MRKRRKMDLNDIKKLNGIAYENVYEVYTHRGEIIVRKGDLGYNGNFYPEGLNIWHCGFRERGIPKPLTLYGRKVWCKTEEDIPKAVEILMARIEAYENETRQRAEKVKQQATRVVWK